MKSGKGSANNRSGPAGGSKGKGKRRRVVNTQGNSAQISYNKNNRQGRNEDKRNGHAETNSSSSGRKWMNGDDSRINKNLKHKSKNQNSSKGHHDNKGDDDRPFGINSIPSTTHTSYSNTSRKGKEFEEDKERLRKQSNSSNNYRANDD